MRTISRLVMAAAAASLLATSAVAKPPEGSQSEPQNVRKLHKFAGCTVDRREGETRALLALDFRTKEYERAFRRLVRESEACWPEDGRRRFSSSGILLTGGLAEALLRKDTAGSSLQQKVAFDATKQPIEARTESEFMAMCVVRSAPEDVAALFASEPSSEAEKTAIADMAALGGCLPKSGEARFTRESLRSLLALAAYRLIQHNAAALAAGK